MSALAVKNFLESNNQSNPITLYQKGTTIGKDYVFSFLFAGSFPQGQYSINKYK